MYFESISSRNSHCYVYFILKYVFYMFLVTLEFAGTIQNINNNRVFCKPLQHDLNFNSIEPIYCGSVLIGLIYVAVQNLKWSRCCSR